MNLINNIFQPLANLGNFWQGKTNAKIFRWNLIFIISQITFLFWKFNLLPPQVPLYYSLPWGGSQLTNASLLFILPTISLILLLINHLFAISLTKISLLLSRLLLSISLVFSFLSLIALLHIVYLIV
jgi:hypothetical protein